MSEDSVEILAFHDENVNSLNFVPTSPRGLTRIGGVNCAGVATDRGLKEDGCRASNSMNMGRLSTPKSKDRKCRQSNVVTQQSPSDDDIAKFRALSPVGDDTVDEIMQFRANSSESDDEDPGFQNTPPQTTSNNRALMNSFNIARLRMLPTILEVATANSEESSDAVLSHEGTEYTSPQESIELEDLFHNKCEDDNNETTEALDAVPVAYIMPSSPNFKTRGLKSSTSVNVQPKDNGLANISDILADSNSLAVSSPRKGAVALAPTVSPVPSRDALSPIYFRDPTSPRYIENPTSPRHMQPVSPRQSEDPAQIISPRRQPLDPISPRQTQEPAEVIICPRQRQDPPSRLLELNDQVVKCRFSVKEAEVEATRHKEELDEQLRITKEYIKQLRAMRKAEAMLQADLQRELKEVALQNEALRADIKRLESTKKELQDARSEVEDEEAELNELKEQLKNEHEALEEEVSTENQAMQDQIGKLVAAKKELAEAKFKAEKEEAELVLMKKEHERQLQLLEEEKEQLGLAMEQAANETNETNELTRQTLSELEEYKANVEADMILVREMHESRMLILKEEKAKLEAAMEQASKDTTEVKGMAKQILEDLEELTKKEEAEVNMLRKEYAERMKLLEEEKESLAAAMEEAANETTETKEMTRTVKSELEEYKVKLEMDMQTEIKDLKKEIRRMEEKHEVTMEKLVIKSEALQEEITAEQEEIEQMVNAMEESIESLHQQKENMENELTLRIESVNQSTKESKRELQQELNKARFSKAKMGFDSMRGHAKHSLKCATEDSMSYNIKSFSSAAFQAIMEPFSDDLLIKQARAPEFRPTTKKGAKQGAKQGTKQSKSIRQTSSHSKIIVPRSPSKSIRQTSSAQMEGKIVSPREILL